jgi:hypothetical protein
MKQWDNVRHQVFQIDGKQTQWVDPKEPTCHHCGSPDHLQPKCQVRLQRKALQANRKANTAAMQKPTRTTGRILVVDSQRTSTPARPSSQQSPSSASSPSQRDYRTAAVGAGSRANIQGNASKRLSFADAASGRGSKPDKGKGVDRGNNIDNGRQPIIRTQTEQQSGASTSGTHTQQKTWQQEHAELRQIVNSYRIKLDNQIQMWQEQLLRQETRMNAMATTLDALDSKIDTLLGLRKREEYDYSQYSVEEYDNDMAEAPALDTSANVVPGTPLAPIDDTIPSVTKRLCSVRDESTFSGSNSARKYEAEQLVAHLERELENSKKYATSCKERADSTVIRAEQAERELRKSVRLHLDRDTFDRQRERTITSQSQLETQATSEDSSTTDKDL